MLNRISGLVAAPFTPFDSAGDLQLKTVEQQAEHLVATGVSGAFVCGTTGEGMSLSIAERQTLAARWVEVAGDKLTIIVHTGHNSIAEAQALAAHAQKIGAHATAAIPPCFHKPANVSDLVACVAEIASAASGLPFYYYHIPAMTGVAFSMASFLLAAADDIPNLRGVKFTYENLMDFSSAQKVENGRYDILFGRDEILLSGLSVGAKGAVGSTYNYAAPLFSQIIAAFKLGDLAQAQYHHGKVVEFMALLGKHGGLIAAKAVMAMIGIDCGPCRLPLRTLCNAQRASLEAELDAIGFFDAIRPVHGVGASA